MTWSGCGPMPSRWLGMLEAYAILARFYDLCMEVDYGEWVDYLLDLCRRHGHEPRSIADLGCGTGNLTIPLAAYGYYLTGVDLSPAMVAQAQCKAAELGLDIPWHVGDLRELSLPTESFDTAISGCDVLNYLLTEADLIQAVQSVYRLLSPGGLWLFDLNSSWKLQEMYGSSSYADLRDDFAYFWDNRFSEAEGICTMDLTFFVRGTDGKYERISERHRQRLWLPGQVAELCSQCGFTVLGCYDFLTTAPTSSEAERWQFVVRKPKKSPS